MNRITADRRFFNKSDLIFISLLLILAAVILCVQLKAGDNKQISAYKIKVLSNPPKEQIFFAPQQKPVVIKGLRGNSVIEWNNKGKIRFAASACPNQTCVNTGWRSEGSIVCVPNGIIINIVSSNNQQFDAVTR